MPKSNSEISNKTIERYASIWNKFQASNVSLSDLDKITYQEFSERTNINSESQFRLTKSLARNSERQIQVNQWLDKKDIPKTYTKRLPEKQVIPKRAVVYKEVKEIKFHKSKYGLQGYDKHQANFLSHTYSKSDIKKHYKITKQAILKSNNNLIVDSEYRNYAIQTKINITVFNPKDKTTSDMVFYGNGRLYNKLESALDDTNNFIDNFNNFTSRLIQSELTYKISSTQTTLRVIG